MLNMSNDRNILEGTTGKDCVLDTISRILMEGMVRRKKRDGGEEEKERNKGVEKEKSCEEKNNEKIIVNDNQEKPPATAVLPNLNIRCEKAGQGLDFWELRPIISIAEEHL
ncbi:hypothetical protein FACS1894152_7440 [Bacilli bacterium]|nr:hypothetical protein FACS1894152_7440 [Bacilli bacterium]